jgi:prepilin-type N-terminal cleavage/methylation domain-containing protein
MRRKGLTLIELLLTVSLVSVIGMTLYSSLASGINVARRITRPASDEDLAIFFEKISREVANSFPYSEIPFQGDELQFSFPTLIRSEKPIEFDSTVGRVTYLYESSSNRLSRRQENVSQVHEEEESKSGPVLRDVTSLSFQYFVLDSSTKEYLWSEEWDSVEQDGKLPLAVQMTLEYSDEGKKRELVRTIPIPTGG